MRSAHLQIPTGGANPPAPSDFDVDLPLAFTRAGAEFIWRNHLPFLPRADELVARGARPSYSNTPFFEIERFLLGFVDMTALRAVRAIDATLSVEAVDVFRIFNFMRISKA